MEGSGNHVCGFLVPRYEPSTYELLICFYRYENTGYLTVTLLSTGGFASSWKKGTQASRILTLNSKLMFGQIPPGYQVGRKEMFHLMMHSTQFYFLFMVIWHQTYGLRTILIVRKETSCHHIGYTLRLTARVLLYAPSHRQDSTYHGLCYTSRSR